MSNNNLITGVSCLHYRWASLTEAFARLDEWDLDLVEFSTTSLQPDDYPQVGSLAAQSGKLTSLHAWDDLAQMEVAEGVQQSRRLLQLCEQMKAGQLILHFGTHPRRTAGLDRLIEIIGTVAPDYEQSEVLLCLENHYPYDYRQLWELGSDPADALHVLQGVDSPAVRFCLDYGHSNMAANTSDFIEQLAPYLAYVHIADNEGVDDNHLAPGEGTVDWPVSLAQTLNTGFRGPFILEYPENDEPARFHRFLQLLHHLAHRPKTEV
jgi:sugar phosphate isomerase/epimerase